MQNIIEELDRKVQTYQDILVSRFLKESGINLNVNPQRDNRELIAITPIVKTWFSDVEKIQASNSATITNLVAEYFKKSEQFSHVLTKWVAFEILEGDVNAVQKFINVLAMAVAHEKVQQSIVAYLFAVTPNSN